MSSVSERLIVSEEEERTNKENRMETIETTQMSTTTTKKRKSMEEETGKITSFFLPDPTKTKKKKKKLEKQSELEMLIDRATMTASSQCEVDARPKTPPVVSLNNMIVSKAATKEKDNDDQSLVKKNMIPVRKPRSAFNYFFKAQKNQLQKVQPSLKYDDLKKEARNLWNLMNTKARAPFEEMARNDKERYKKENAASLSSPSKWQDKKNKNDKTATTTTKKRNISKTRTKARAPFKFYDMKRRDELRVLHPNKKYTELMQIARLEWDGMTAEKRAPYVDMSNKEKEEVRKANPPRVSKRVKRKTSKEMTTTTKKKKTTPVPSPARKIIRAPRKAKDAFEHFKTIKRKEIKDTIESKEDQNKHLDMLWSSLSSEDRETYHAMAKKDQERFEKATKDYENRKKDEKKRENAQLRKECDKLAHVAHPKSARDAVGHFKAHMRKIVREGLKEGEKFSFKNKFEEMVKMKWSKMDLKDRMSFVEKAKKDKERYEKAMEEYEVKSKEKKEKVLRAKRYVLKLREEIQSTKLRKPKEKKSALQHFCKTKRKTEEEGKKAWNSLSAKEKKEYTKIAQKDLKRFRTENKEYERKKKILELSVPDAIKMRLEERKNDLKRKEQNMKVKKDKEEKKEKELKRKARENDRVKKLKEKEEAKARKERRKNELMWRKALEARYPIEDTMLDSEPPLTSKSLPPRSEASCRLPLRDDTIHSIETLNQDTGKLLMCWDFLHVFSKILSLSPVNLNDLCCALSCKIQTLPLVSETFMSLLRTYVKDMSQAEKDSEKEKHVDGNEEEEETDLEKWKHNQMCLHMNLPHSHHITSETWPEVLRVFLVIQVSSGTITDDNTVRLIKDVVSALKSEPFHEIKISYKIEALRALVMACYDTSRVSNTIREHISKRQKIYAEKRKLEAEDKKKRKEAAAAARREKEKLKKAKEEKAKVLEEKQKNSMKKWLSKDKEEEEEKQEEDTKQEEEEEENDDEEEDEEEEKKKGPEITKDGFEIVKLSSLSAPKVTIEEVEPDTDSEDSEEEDRAEILEDLIGDGEFGLSRQDKLQLRRNKLKKVEERRLRREKRQKRRNARKEQIEARDNVVKQRRGVLDSIDDATVSRDYDALASSLEMASQVGLRGGNRRRQWCVRKVYDAEKLLETLKEERDVAEAVARARRQFQSKMLKCQVRTEPLGMDRDFNTFWRFSFDEKKIRIFVQNIKNKTWQYYSRVAEIKSLHDSLDRRGIRERALQERLKDYLDSLKDDIEEEEEENENENEEEKKMDVDEAPIVWKKEGPFMGRHIRRVFDDEPSDAVVTGYVPEEGGDMALWHVRHLDGDEEDLEKYELDEAIARYDANDINENAAYVTYVNTKVKRDQRAEKMSSSDEQTSLRNLVLRVGQSVVKGLKDHKSEWAVTSKRLKRDDGHAESTYVDWKEAVLSAQSIAEYRSLIADLESSIHKTQETPDRPKFTEWRFEGHEYIGTRVRHFFEKSTDDTFHCKDGMVVAWKPADEDDEDLFKIAFDKTSDEEQEEEESSKKKDSEEEEEEDSEDEEEDDEDWKVSELEVDEEELKRDMKHHEEDAKIPTKRWKSSGPHVGSLTRRFFNVHGVVDGKIIGYRPPRDGNKALWHVKHDDGDEEDLEEFEVKWAVEAKKKDEKEGWITIDSRDYWIGKRAIRHFDDGDVEGRIVAAWLPLYEERMTQTPLWCMMHDDGEFEDLEQYEVDAAVEEWESLHNDDKDDDDDVAKTTDTLWPYLEARERWKACLLQASTYSLMYLLVDALQDHAALYGVAESFTSGKKSNKRSAIARSVRAWYYSPSSSHMISSRTQRALNRSKGGKNKNKKGKKKKRGKKK